MLAHQSPADSPGDGTMAATRITILTGTRVHTRGAVNPPRDWATTARSVRSPTASTTTSAYTDNPASSSSQGRSGATTSKPFAANSGATSCQYHESDAAPWISTNVVMGTPATVLPTSVLRRYRSDPARSTTHRPRSFVDRLITHTDHGTTPWIPSNQLL